MGAHFEELDRRQTPMGEISLRRRRETILEVDVFEAKLGDEFLMSSLFTVAEVALADLGLAAADGDDLEVVVGGLGLGYTAVAALADRRVASLHVVEALGEVVDWHRHGLLPAADELTSDPRCHLVVGSFFALAAQEDAAPQGLPQQFDAVLIDIDHSPRRLLHASHGSFYEPDGLRRLAARLRPDGVFALWSDDPPDQPFMEAVEQAFASCSAHEVSFANPLTGGESTNTIYVAARPT